MFDVKQRFVGSTLGNIALSLRDSFDLLKMAVSNPESVGTLANDQLATMLVVSLCKSLKTFVDVGAHIGSVFSLVIQRDPSIKIVAIEAMPAKIISLRKRFPAIELHGCAVGSIDGEVSFFVDTKLSGYSSLGRPPDDDPSRVREIRVPIRKIDGLLSHDQVDVMKIDVEGAELGVLEGSEGLIAQSRPTIMFESGPTSPGSAISGLRYTKEAMWQWFRDRDYGIFVPNRVAHNDSGLGLDGFIEGHIYPRRTTNYFAIPHERRTEIRDTARAVLAISAP